MNERVSVCRWSLRGSVYFDKYSLKAFRKCGALFSFENMNEKIHHQPHERGIYAKIEAES